MKSLFFTRRRMKFVMAIFFMIFIASCIEMTPVIHFQVSDSYKTLGINKIGILVIRMGNEFPTATIPLKPETDFANRTPDYGWHGAISEKTRNIYIEDEKRLKESFPFYPATTEKPIRYLTDHFSFEFYKNFSADIYEMLNGTFREKGYEVVNIAEIAKNWKKPISESTVAEIIEQSKSAADSIAIFQYMDLGSSTSRVGSISTERKGFIELNYSMYMFDTKTNAEILSYKKDFFAAAVIAMLNDPEIMDNPQYKDKIKKFSKGFAGWKRYFIINELPDDIIVKKLMTYIKSGFFVKHNSLGDMKWTGLSSVIPGK